MQVYIEHTHVCSCHNSLGNLKLGDESLLRDFQTEQCLYIQNVHVCRHEQGQMVESTFCTCIHVQLKIQLF